MPDQTIAKAADTNFLSIQKKRAVVLPKKRYIFSLRKKNQINQVTLISPLSIKVNLPSHIHQYIVRIKKLHLTYGNAQNNAQYMAIIACPKRQKNHFSASTRISLSHSLKALLKKDCLEDGTQARVYIIELKKYTPWYKTKLQDFVESHSFFSVNTDS